MKILNYILLLIAILSLSMCLISDEPAFRVRMVAVAVVCIGSVFNERKYRIPFSVVALALLIVSFF